MELTADDLIKLEKEHPGKVKIKVEIEDGDGGEISHFVNIAKKKWYKSKTIIFNLFFAIFTGLASILDNDAFRELSGEYFPVILTVVTIGNVFLRTITVSPVEK